MRKKGLLVILILSAAAFLASAGMLVHYWLQDRSDARVRGEVAALRPTDGAVDDAFTDLLAANPDTIGWLRVEGTDIDDVVMQAPYEKDKYLHLDFNGNYSVRGTYYLAEECDVTTSDNLIIYGHHMKDGTMFGELANYQDAAYAAQHPTIRFHTLYTDHTYEVVAAIPTQVLPDWSTAFKYYEYTGSDETVFQQYCAFIEANRLYDTGVTLSPGDRLLTLSTCSYHTTDGRFIVVARQVD